MNHITDHIAQSLNRLLTQYKGKQRIEDLISALVSEFQDIEDMFWDLILYRSINSSIGTQLDGIGQIVGINRKLGESDYDYTIRLKAQIILNISQGQPEKIIEAFILLSGATKCQVLELNYATVTISGNIILSAAEANDILAVLEKIAGAGVRVDYIGYFTDTPFAFSGISIAGGFGTTTDPLVGGQLASVLSI